MSVKPFTVSHGGVRIKVRVLPTIKDVHRAYQSCPGGRARGGLHVPAFFLETKNGKHTGTVFLPLDGRLAELVPHEVSHAVIHARGGVLPRDDEEYCTTVGILCARIINKIEAANAR
ncbi:MAG: hypothetical protein PHD37_17680 [Gallionellaceae bacterium]|nr:hypothetical protein [Gallionellaceae bacterium]